MKQATTAASSALLLSAPPSTVGSDSPHFGHLVMEGLPGLRERDLSPIVRPHRGRGCHTDCGAPPAAAPLRSRRRPAPRPETGPRGGLDATLGCMNEPNRSGFDAPSGADTD